jgi:hypothetical protein
MVCDLNVDLCEPNRGCYIERNIRKIIQPGISLVHRETRAEEWSAFFSNKKPAEFAGFFIVSNRTDYLRICACISCTEVTLSVASAFNAIAVAKPPFRVVS